MPDNAFPRQELWTLLANGEYAVAAQALETPETPEEAWLAVITLRLLDQAEKAAALVEEHHLDSPPSTLLDEALIVFHDHAADAPLVELSCALPGNEAIGLLERAGDEGGPMPPALFTRLLGLNIEAGRVPELEALFAQAPFEIHPNTVARLSAVASVHAAVHRTGELALAVSRLETFEEPMPRLLPLLWLDLSASAHARTDFTAAAEYAWRAVQLVEPTCLSYDADPQVRVRFKATDDGHRIPLDLVVSPAWRAQLDILTSDERYPVEVRAYAKLLRATVDPPAAEPGDVDEARGTLGDTPWVWAASHPVTGNFLADLRAYKGFATTYLTEHGPTTLDTPSFKQEGDLDQDQTFGLHRELLDWPEVFGQGEASEIPKQAQQYAWWTNRWVELLEKHSLNAEICEAARALLAAEGQNHRGLLFTLAFHAHRLNTPEGRAEARQTYERLRELTPDDAAVMNNLALLLEQDGDLDGARALFEQAATTSPDDDLYVRNHLRFLTRMAEWNPDPVEGARLLREHLDAHWDRPLPITVLAHLLELQVQAGDAEGLERTLAHASLLVTESTRLRLLAFARVLAASRDPRADLQAVADTLAHQHDMVELHLALAALAAQRGSPALAWAFTRHAAREAERTAPAHYPDLPETLQVRGSEEHPAYVTVNLPAGWQAVFDDVPALKGTPDEVRGALLLLRAMLRHEGEGEHRKLVIRARELLGDTRWVQFLTRATDDPVVDLRTYKSWVGSYLPDRNAAVLDILPFVGIPALTDSENLDREQTLALHTELLTWPDVFSDGEGAELRDAVQLAAWRGGWQTLLRQHKLHREVCEAARVVLSMEEDAQTLFVLGYHATQTRDPGLLEEGVRAYRRYLELHPDNPAVLNNLGWTLEVQGKLDEAAQYYEAALRVDAEHEFAPRNLTRVRNAQALAPLKARGIDLRFTDKSNPQKRELARSYWDRTDVGWTHLQKDLQQRFGVTAAQVREVAVGYAWAYATNSFCQDCGTPYEYTSRKDFEDRQRYNRGVFICAKCQQKRAEQSRQQEAQVAQERQQILNATYDLVDVPALNMDDLSLKDAVFLASVTRAGASEDLRYIAPLDEHETAIGPTRAYSLTMLKHLHDRRVLRVHPASSPAAFDWSGKQVKLLDFAKIHWGIAAGGQQLPFGALIEQVEARLREGPDRWPEDWVREMPQLWREITLDEALRYLVYCLNQHHFDFNPGEKTELTMRVILEDFSLAQAWNLSWRAAKDAAAYYQRSRVPRDRAANSAVTNLKNSAENHKANGWVPKPARRDFNTPMPVVSQVLFTHALKLGAAYQEQLPPALDGV